MESCDAALAAAKWCAEQNFKLGSSIPPPPKLFRFLHQFLFVSTTGFSFDEKRTGKATISGMLFGKAIWLQEAIK
jgi:hypothetical protein